MSNLLEFPKKGEDKVKQKAKQVSANHQAAYNEIKAIARKYNIPSFMITFSQLEGGDYASGMLIDTTEYWTNDNLTPTSALQYQVNLIARAGEIYEVSLNNSPFADTIREEVSKRVLEVQEDLDKGDV